MLSCQFYVHLTNLYIFGTKLSRDNEKSHIFDEQMSKCRLSRLEKRWGLYLVLDGGPYLHIQFHDIFTTSNFSRPVVKTYISTISFSLLFHQTS